MSAIDELRRMLDERGVEWRKTPHYSIESQDNETIFKGNGIEWYTNDHMNGQLGLRALRYEVTPAQAIDATLGRGACENVGYYIDSTRFKCSACGYNGWTKYAADGEDKVPNYCPNCGRKVVN